MTISHDTLHLKTIFENIIAPTQFYHVTVDKTHCVNMLLLTSACKSVSAHAIHTSASFIGVSMKFFEKAD